MLLQMNAEENVPHVLLCPMLTSEVNMHGGGDGQDV